MRPSSSLRLRPRTAACAFLSIQVGAQLFCARDLEYVGTLLHDFLRRAKEQPAELFEQLSSLNVGPLVTVETGERISDHPALAELSSRFLPLKCDCIFLEKLEH
jgi:hypothetical protein